MWEQAAALVLVEQGIQTFGVEEATGALAVQHLADLGVPRLFPQPLGERGDEALLGHGGRGLRQHAAAAARRAIFVSWRPTRWAAGSVLARANTSRSRRGTRSSSDDAMDILVRLQEDVLLKPGENVGGLHGRDLVGRIPTRFPAAFDFREQGRCELPGRGAAAHRAPTSGAKSPSASAQVKLYSNRI